MEPSDKLWHEASLVDFTNIELLHIHGFLCISLSLPQTLNASSRNSMFTVLSKILDHLKGIELLSDQDMQLIKNQENLLELSYPK